MDDAHKTLTVFAGSLLQGAVTVHVINGGPGFVLAPLIQSLVGQPRDFLVFHSKRSSGRIAITARVKLTAPTQPGTYHIIFAFQLETNGGSVASATNWARHNNIWNDGNDIADFNSSQIQQAQRMGCAINPWLTETGIQSTYVPADALTVDVAAR